KETILINSGNIAIAGKLVSITPSANFALDAIISVEMDTCFKNAKGAHNQPITSGSWTFQTLTSHKVINLTPANKAIDVVINHTLAIDFDRIIKIGNNGNLSVYENGLLV